MSGGAPPFLREIRAKVGNSLLVLPAVSGAVFDSRRRLLMIRHSNDGSWQLPGGIVEPDEDPAMRVVVEMREEVGLDVKPIRLLGVHGGPDCRVTYRNGDVVSYVVISFECAVVGGTPVADGVESLEVAYVSEAEAAALPLSAIGRVDARLAFGQSFSTL